MKKLLRLLVIICLIATSFSLIGCSRPYKGKDISSISFRYDRNNEVIFDFDTATATETLVTVESVYPEYKTSTSTKTYPLDRSKYKKLFNDLNKCGFFKLKELYELDGVICDGGWTKTITVNYADGTTFESTCINADNGLEKKYGIAFYDFCGEYLVGYVPDTYRIPPGANVTVFYNFDHRTYSVGFPATLTNYTLHQKTVDNIDLLDGAQDCEKFIFEKKMNYNFGVSTKVAVKLINVDQYDLNGRLEGCVIRTNDLTNHGTQLQGNKIYKITVTYKKHGTAEYVFRTQAEEE